MSDPGSLVHAIFNETITSKKAKSRYIMRLLPVIGTCKASEDKIKKLAEEVLVPYFADSVGHTFCIQIKIRNNGSMSRQALIPLLADVIKTLNPTNQANLDAPDYVINIDILRAVCCLSVLKDFAKFRKFNLQEAAMCKEKGDSASTRKGKQNDDSAATCKEKQNDDSAATCKEKQNDDSHQEDSNKNVKKLHVSDLTTDEKTADTAQDELLIQNDGTDEMIKKGGKIDGKIDATQPEPFAENAPDNEAN